MLRIGTRADAVRAVRYWFSRDPAPRVFSPDAWLVLAATVAWYATAYLINDSVPSFDAHTNLGWLGWWDQGHYITEAAELAQGQVRPSVYWFGYPALGAPFYWLLPRHPFLVPDIAGVLAMVAVFYAACRHHVTRIEAVLLVYVFIWLDSFLRDGCLVIPWNTMPAYTAFFVSIYLLVFRRESRVGHFIACAILAGIAMAARPTEIAALGIIYGVALFRLARPRERASAAAVYGLVVAGMAAVTLSLNEHLYQAWRSPYMNGETAKLHAANYGLKAWQFFYDSVFLTGDGALPEGTRPPSLFSRYPEFLFVLPGALYLVQRHGWAAAGVAISILYTIGFYLLYVPFDNPPYAWSYGQWHYVAWMLPWLGLAAYLSVRQAPWTLSRGLWVTAFLLPLVGALVLGFVAEPLASATLQTSDKMRLAASFDEGVYTVLLRADEPGRIEDVRLVFDRPPAFGGTEASSSSRVHVAVDHVEQAGMRDYMMSQENAKFHFTFLAHGLDLRAGDEIEISFKVRQAPEVARAELAGIRYAPLQAFRDYFGK